MSLISIIRGSDADAYAKALATVTKETVNQEQAEYPYLLLTAAIQAKKPQVVRDLLARGANPLQKAKYNMSPLKNALESVREPQQVEIANLVIEEARKIDRNATQKIIYAAFLDLLRNDNHDPITYQFILQHLISNGILNQEQTDYPHLPLTAAIRAQKPQVVRDLLTHGADPLQKAKYNMSALKSAFESVREPQQIEIANLVVEAARKIDRNATQDELNKLLIERAKENNQPACKILLQQGAEREAENETGENAILAAVSGSGNAALLEFLFKAGVALYKTNHIGLNALQLAALHQRDASVLQFLFDNGFSILQRMPKMDTHTVEVRKFNLTLETEARVVSDPKTRREAIRNFLYQKLQIPTIAVKRVQQRKANLSFETEPLLDYAIRTKRHALKAFIIQRIQTVHQKLVALRNKNLAIRPEYLDIERYAADCGNPETQRVINVALGRDFNSQTYLPSYPAVQRSVKPKIRENREAFSFRSKL